MSIVEMLRLYREISPHVSYIIAHPDPFDVDVFRHAAHIAVDLAPLTETELDDQAAEWLNSMVNEDSFNELLVIIRRLFNSDEQELHKEETYVSLSADGDTKYGAIPFLMQIVKAIIDIVRELMPKDEFGNAVAPQG